MLNSFSRAHTGAQVAARAFALRRAAAELRSAKGYIVKNQNRANENHNTAVGWCARVVGGAALAALVLPLGTGCGAEAPIAEGEEAEVGSTWAAINEPKCLGASLDGNVRRAIDIPEGAKIDEKALKALVKEAVGVNRGKRAGRR